MVSVGLMPSHTGQEGGNKTGQNMSDYPKENGVFLKALDTMPDEFKLPFTSVEGDRRISNDALMGLISLVDGEQTVSKSGKRTKYTCSCGFNVWGKDGLKITCDECQSSFVSDKEAVTTPNIPMLGQKAG